MIDGVLQLKKSAGELSTTPVLFSQLTKRTTGRRWMAAQRITEKAELTELSFNGLKLLLSHDL
jgi:hypothetical protein